jgi:2-keto-4-pentenoate hydratase/2-oxohepta-3-ene-1,7-dioic acid hydratase in catechol pathway
MKLVTFAEGSSPDHRVGRIDGDVVVELDCGSTREYFERGGAVGETGARPARADVTLRAPIVPKKFFHTAGNFTEHHEELAKVNWSHPVHKGIVFFQNVDAIIGPEDPVIYPEHLTSELDYELELAIIIGKSGKFFSADEAPDYIAGFTVFNDITARDIQRREMKSGVFSFSKAIDTFCPIGPWIVTADEIDPAKPMHLTAKHNGEVTQDDTTASMIFSFADLIAYVTTFMTIRPADIISTGTPVKRKSDAGAPRWLKPGDVVEISSRELGTLQNRVVDET